MAALVPELYVSDLASSLEFYVRFGFAVRYRREADAFAWIERGEAALMLEEPRSRVWLAGALERPYGRGINLQITVDDVAALHDIARRASLDILLPLEERHYDRGVDEIKVRQFVLPDPDGYLIRFSETLAIKPAHPPATP